MEIKERNKDVMVVNIYGNKCEMDQIREICEEKQIMIVEECDEGLGNKWKKSKVGKFGEVEKFSLFGKKKIKKGEGGMVIERNNKVMEK